jgi:hypothetical protein
MAIDPRISLAAQPIDLANLFAKNQANELGRAEITQQREQAPFRNRLLELQTGLAEAQQPGQLQVAQEAASPIAQLNRRDKARLQSVAQAAQELSPLLEANDFAGARSQLIARKARLVKLNLPTETTDESLELLSGNPDLLRQRTAQAITLGQQAGFLKGARTASTKAFAPIVDPATGELGIPTFDPATGQAGFQQVPGAPVQQTSAQKREAEIKERLKISEIAVTETERKAVITQRVKRSSAIKKELSERNRSAARSGRTLRQALTLAQKANQGFTGAAKLQLSRLLPGVDASNEAALDATLRTLALEQLQQFKGPTTDFEFGVTESISGSLGQSQSANIARIKSLDRARFFNEREFKQFDDHVKSGGDPDSFSFNFGEPVKTKKGVFTLQDIQDTAVQNNLTIEETIKRLNK